MPRSARVFPLFLNLLFVATVVGASGIARADDPLHARIDQLIDAKEQGPAAAMTTDAEFLRRVTLDLAGRIPTADESRAFLVDSSADKRQKLVDALLAAPDYSRRMSQAFHVMLMERLGDNDDWSKFLEHAFQTNMPWDEIVRNIARPDTESEQTRGAAFFLTKRLENYGQNPVDLPALTRDMGRLFMGVDLQCAQCHDHPHIDDYKQHDFQGLFAFINHTFIRNDVKFPAVGEKIVTSKIEFESVFLPGKKQTGPRLPFSMEFDVLTFEKGQEFAVEPDKTTKFPGVPKFSPLSIMAERLPSEENDAFAVNAANRLWYLLMGRGIVHPLDLRHKANPPSHPELLDLLADEFRSHKYDIKWLLREIALSNAYQRSSLLPEGTDGVPLTSFRAALEKPLSAEQLLWSMLVATGEFRQIVPADQNIAAVDMKENKKYIDYRSRFVEAFANPPREPEVEFAPSVKAALFLLNDTAVIDWLNPKPGNLVERLSKLDDAGQVAEELYISVLSRTPADDEKKAVVDYLAGQPAEKRAKAIGHLAWSLLASTEFCVNH